MRLQQFSFPLWLALFGLLAIGTTAVGQQAAPEEVSPRLREEASRPLRWIIESSRLKRNDDKPAPRAKATTVAAKSEPPASAAASRPAVNEASSAEAVVAATSPVATAAPPVVAVAPSPAPRAAPQARPVESVASAAAPVRLAALNPKAARPPAIPLPPPAPVVMEDERLVPLVQEPPQVWPGYCMNRKCEKYFYRVGFKVKPDGQVRDVKLVASNNATFSDVVLKAVSQWRYQPIGAEREEEVVLRISSW